MDRVMDAIEAIDPMDALRGAAAVASAERAQAPSLHANRKPLYLSEEETAALLESCLMTTVPDSAAHYRALTRLGDLYREFVRSERR